MLPTGASSSDAQVQAALAAFRTTEEKLDATALKQAISKLGVAVTSQVIACWCLLIDCAHAGYHVNSQEAMSLFDYIDQDHSRYITADELKEWITLCLGSSVASGADGAATTASSYSTTQYASCCFRFNFVDILVTWFV